MAWHVMRLGKIARLMRNLEAIIISLGFAAKRAGQ